MSCSSCGHNPCNEVTCDASNEPLASALNNFIVAFFGSLTKTCVNNQVVWLLPCDLDAGIPGYDRIAGEGLACYFKRVFASISASTLVKVDDNDTVPGNLIDKLAAGNETSFAILNPGGDEQIQINHLLPASVSISASNIDWSLSNGFFKTLGANTVFTFTNDQDCKTIVVAITNTAGNFTATWPVAVRWRFGIEPVLTIGVKTDVFTFVKINNIIWGSVVADLS